MTLIEENDSQPDWVDREEGLKDYKNIYLGQRFIHNRKDPVRIIHIQQVEGFILLRLELSNGASITELYEFLPDTIQ